HLQRLTAYGVGYRSLQEAYLDSCGLFKDAVISVLATIAKQERVRLSERTIAGLERARAQGAQLGRPRVASNSDSAKARELRLAGMSLRNIARTLGLNRMTVQRLTAS